MSEVNWFKLNDDVTHFCGGSEDEKKNNKPQGTQIEATKWFNPASLDEEAGEYKCKACGLTLKRDEQIIKVGE